MPYSPGGPIRIADLAKETGVTDRAATRLPWAKWRATACKRSYVPWWPKTLGQPEQAIEIPLGVDLVEADELPAENGALRLVEGDVLAQLGEFVEDG